MNSVWEGSVLGQNVFNIFINGLEGVKKKIKFSEETDVLLL